MSLSDLELLQLAGRRQCGSHVSEIPLPWATSLGGLLTSASSVTGDEDCGRLCGREVDVHILLCGVRVHGHSVSLLRSVHPPSCLPAADWIVAPVSCLLHFH